MVSIYVAIGEELQTREGEWALLKHASWASVQTYIRKALGSEFEVVTRLVPGMEPGRKSYDIYARYIGNGHA
jgi:hypothetical protein